MKIVCDSCGAKYQIADEKVRGKVFKIRCKKCSDVIVVKGSSGEDGGGAEASEPQQQGGYDDALGGGAAAEWYAVIEGDQVGPITPEEVEGYFDEGVLEAGSFVWREGLEDWQPLEEIEAFEHLSDAAGQMAGPDEKTVVADPSEEFGGGEEEAKTVVSEPGEFGDFGMGEQAGAESGGFEMQENPGGDAASPSVEIDDSYNEEAGGEPAGEMGGNMAAGMSGTNEDPTDTYDRQEATGGGMAASGQQSSAAGGQFGELEQGGEQVTGGMSSTGGHQQSGAQQDGMGGQQQNGQGGSANFESFGGQQQQQSVGGGGQGAGAQAQSGQGGGGSDPRRTGDDLVDQRSENSVLFSLSSVDNMEAVDGEEQQQQENVESGAGATTEGSGLIDIQSLASSHAAMSSNDGGQQQRQQPSPGGGGAAPAAGGQQQAAGASQNLNTGEMPQLMPSGSRKSNTGLIIAVIAGFVILAGAVVTAIWLLNRDPQPKKIDGQKPMAANSRGQQGGAQAQNQGDKKKAAAADEDSKEGEGNKEGDNKDGDEKKAEKEGDKEGEKAGEKKEGEEKKAADKDDADGEDDDGSKAVAANSNTGSSGRDRGSRPAPDPDPTPTRNTNRGGGSGGSSGSSGSGGDDDLDSLLGNVGNEKESGGSSGGSTNTEPKRDLPETPTKAMVMKTIRKYSGRISGCGENNNRNNLSGSVKVHFTVKPSGRVSGPTIKSSKFRGTDVGKCVVGVVRSMKFPATQKGMPVLFPFSL